ncbi:MAG: ABC transporter ATP-binding protein [Eubacteriales bacterium]|nr:ABC transporter ATP-binding protein [Eubacteriales bacterium]
MKKTNDGKSEKAGAETGLNIIHAQDIYKQFGDEAVLRGIDLNVSSGEIVGILGPSGAGKTTLIKCLIGTLGLNRGSVFIHGVAMPSLCMMDRIGYMAQQDALYDDLTGFQNLVFYGRLKGMRKRAAKDQSHELMALVELSGDESKKVAHYSGGMKRRLSLAAALIGDPDVIVLDEPTVGIDPVLRELFWQEFGRLKAKGRAIMITTHVMDEAEKCDRLILLRDGTILENGSPERLKQKTPKGTLEAVFLESAKRQITEGRTV